MRPDRPTEEAPAKVRQVVYVVRRPDKLAALGRILDVEDPAAALVFARTRGEVDDLAEALSGRGHDAAALHGGLSQEQRDRVMGRFREGALDVLVATDVAARGLDIEHVSHVVNFDVPSSPDDYVHRIGRTGRAGREGTAITLVEPREHRLLQNIEAATRTRLERETRAHGGRPPRAAAGAAAGEPARAPGGGGGRGTDGDGTGREPAAAGAGVRPTSTATARWSRRWPTSTTRWRSRSAAIALLDAREAPGDAEVEIAPAVLPQDRPPRPVRPGGRPAFGAGTGRAATWSATGCAARTGDRSPRGRALPPAPPGSGSSSAAGGAPGSGRPTSSGRSRRRPACPGSVIGAIQITDSFSLVDVAGDVVDQVVRALRGATIRGRTLAVRLDRDSR